MEYYLFGNKLIDQATVDSLVNTNIQPFKDNNNNYVGQSSFIGEMVEALYPPPQMTPLWVGWFKNEVSEYIALNEDFYIRKFLDINDEFLTNVTPEGISTLSQGLTALSYPANLTDLKDDKKREMTYEQVTDPTIEADIRVYSSKRSTGPDSSFNLKFF